MSKHIKLLPLLGIAMALTLLSSCRKSEYIIDEVETIKDQGGGTGTVTWTSDKEYVLNGFVFVNDGQTLTIEAIEYIFFVTGPCYCSGSPPWSLMVSTSSMMYSLFLQEDKSEYIIDEVETIKDQGGGTGTVTWTSDKEYVLNGFVFVNDGQTLTIEAGTVIRARTGQGSLASALIVARGGRIIAEGTQVNPIIFTVEGDDLQGSIPLESRGLWGGLIILGNATINTESGEDMIEGIPISEPRGIYGGSNDDDNSGILRYISIRHGGTNIGEGNEINGLTLGGVGRQTTIEFVEVISNADDGVEFFGGAVNCKNLVVSFCGDDAFDLDQGYHGKGQFWLGINSNSDKCAEINGGLQAIPALPGSHAVIHNATLIRDTQQSVSHAVHFRNYGGGTLNNSIILNPSEGVALRYSDTSGDTWSLFETGRLVLKSNILYPEADQVNPFQAISDLGEDLSVQNQILADSAASWYTSFEDPGISDQDGYTLLPPTTEFDHMAAYESNWFERVSYKGAFGSNNWIEGWTLLYESGFIND